MSRLVGFQGLPNEFKAEVPLLRINMNDSFDGKDRLRKRSRSNTGWQLAFHGTLCNDSEFRVLWSLVWQHSTMMLPLIISGHLLSNRLIKPNCPYTVLTQIPLLSRPTT